jgi:hypothetical protein
VCSAIRPIASPGDLRNTVNTLQFQLGGTLKFLLDEPVGYALVTLTYDGFTVTAKGDVMAYTLPDGNEVKVKISYVDAQGNAAKVDGDIEWSSSDTNVATVQVDAADTSNAVVAASGTIGQVQIVAKADADIGAGVRELITTMDVEVVAGEAIAGTIAPVGESTPIPGQRA